MIDQLDCELVKVRGHYALTIKIEHIKPLSSEDKYSYPSATCVFPNSHLTYPSGSLLDRMFLSSPRTIT